MAQRHSPLVQAAYSDLLRGLLDDAVSDLRGAPVLRRTARGDFWYDTYRIGTAVKAHYIGPDRPELRARLDQLKLIREQEAARRDERRRLVRVLRAENVMGLDAGTGGLLLALAAAGTFRLGGTVVGTHAFRLYECELGVRLKLDQAVITNDLDIAAFEQLSLALEDTASPALGEVLRDFSFSPVPSLSRDRVWRWRQSARDTLVEFLTPSFSGDEDIRPLPTLGVHAQSLHYLNYLISDPIPAAGIYRSGVLLQAPRPERYAIHKLIVADRRGTGPGALKARKDLMQAELLIDVLAEDRPDDLREAYQVALNAGPRWRERIASSLQKLPRARDILISLDGSA